MSAAPVESRESEAAALIHPAAYARQGYPHELWRRLRANPSRFFFPTEKRVEPGE